MKRVLTFILTAGFFSSVLNSGAEGDGPPVTREEAIEALTKQRPTWEASIARPRPRLYFEAGDAARLVASIEKNDPRRPYLDALLRRANQLATQPPREYETPESLVKGHTTLAYARQELWLRDIGDDMVVLAFAALVDHSPQISAKLREMILTACRYPTWGKVGPNIDLSCAHVARGIAIAWDWHPNLWSPEDKALIKSTIRDRVHMLALGNYGRVPWGGSYNENHHHVCINALGLCGLSFYNDIDEAPEWLAATMVGLEKTTRYAYADGSSPEGVPYWTYGMSFLLQLLEGLRPRMDVALFYDAPAFRNAISYRGQSSTPGFDGVLPWGDATGRDFDGPQHLLHRLSTQYNDPAGAWIAKQLPFSVQGSAVNQLWMLLWYRSLAADRPPTLLDHHQTVSDVATMRSGWSDSDYVLTIKSGFTNRNHSHLDAGAIAFAYGSEWLLTAPGYGEGRYDAEFWKIEGPRWNYFSNSTESHGTLVIDGANQRHDTEARGTITRFHSSPSWTWADIDLRQAYAGITSVNRSIIHHRGDYFLILDSVEAPRTVKAEWLLQAGGKVTENASGLMIAGENGTLLMKMIEPASRFSPRVPTRPKVDVPINRIQTFSTSSEGPKITFAAIGEMSSTGTPSALQVTAKKFERGASYEIHGPGWKDEILHANTPQIINLGKGSAHALTTAVRWRGDDTESMMATGLTQINWTGIELKPKKTTALTIERAGESGWVLCLPHSFEGNVTLPGGMKAERLSAEGATSPIDLKSGSIPAGHFVLYNNAAGREAALKKLLPRSVKAQDANFPIEAPPQQPGLSSTIQIVIEAEQTAKQGRGQCEAVTKPGASGDKALRGFGNTSNRQWLRWKFKAAQAGRYHLQVRYCTAAATATATVLLDGRAVSPAATDVAFPSTGGWSVSQSEWRDMIVSGADGKPVLFDLSEGEHELTLINPSAALNLDNFKWIGTGL